MQLLRTANCSPTPLPIRQSQLPEANMATSKRDESSSDQTRQSNQPTGSVSTKPPATSGPAGAGNINPSGPTTGTEGWGNARDEANIAGANPSSTVPGKEGGGNLRTFRCADAGNTSCSWEVSGRTEEELMPQIERHGREAHGSGEWDDSARKKIHNAIRERSAA
jgi:predicted small metal-binding protein